MSPLDAWRAVARLGPRALAARLGSTRPFKITIALTDRCDCRCEACFIWKKPKGAELRPGQIRALLREAPWIRWVNLTGGEPFLRDDVVEVCEAVTSALPRLAVLDLPTTGQRGDRIVTDVARIARLGVPRFYVTVSLDGPPALHDRLRGRAGAFDRAAETFHALRALPGVAVYLGMTLSAANATAVAETLRAVRRRAPSQSAPVGWRDLHLNVFTRSEHYYANRDSPLAPPRAFGQAVERARRAREASPAVTDRIEATYLRLLPEYLRTGRSPLPCQALRASLFVDAQGDVYPCTVFARRLGNALRDPLARVLGDGEAASAREVIARDACPGCWSPCEANPTVVARGPESLWARPRRRR